MLCNLFSCFDPYVNLISFGLVSLKWMVFIFILYFINWQIFTLHCGFNLLMKHLSSEFFNSFKSLIKDLKSSCLMIFSLFFLIVVVNLMGLLPHVFSLSSHLSINLSFSLSLWLVGVLVSLMSSISNFLSHMVPTGTPTVLWVFLVLVETVSQLIRPFTLSIRLMANVMAGHLVLNLLGLFISSSFTNMFFLLFQSLFLLFEGCISLVQAYVFVSLLSLYWDES